MIKNRVLKLAVGLTILPLVLGGCAAFHEAHMNIKQSENHVAKSLQEQRSLKQKPVVYTVNTPYLMGSVIHITSTHALPSIFHKNVHLSTSQPLTLGEFATQITQMTGVPIHVASQVTGYLNASQTGSSLPALPGENGSLALPNESQHKNAIAVNWNGSLSGLLNLVAARTGTFWKYANGHVRFFLTETKAYTVDALPGTTGLTSNISNEGSNGVSGGSGGVGSNGTTNQKASDSASLNIYKSIESGIKAILVESKSAGGSGSTTQVPTSVSANESTGQVIVTASPPELHAVSAYIRQINAEMQKNVMIDVHVYSVTLNQSNNYNLNLNVAFNRLGHGITPLLNGEQPSLGAGGPQTVPSNIQGPQVESGPSGQGSISAGIVTGAINAQIVASALATQGNVSLVTSGSVIAMNGQPTPMQVAHMHSYVASSSTTQTASVGSSTSLTPGQYTTGFSATFLPLVRNRRILLEYTINLTQNLGLQTFTSGTSSLQLPNLAMQAFMQRVAIRSGQTLVLSGFEQGDNQVNHGGIGSPDFWGLGGGAGAIHNKTALVVVIHVVKLGD